MAGYSGTPLPAKLGIKPGSRVLFIDAAPQFADTLGELPPGVQIVEPGSGVADVIVCFVTGEAALGQRFGTLKPMLDEAGGLWIAWPKRTRGNPASLTENQVREFGLAAGLVDNKVCAIDEGWSGLRFVYRLADRAATKPVRGRAR